MSDLIIAKFDADGNKLWSRQRGSASDQHSHDVVWTLPVVSICCSTQNGPGSTIDGQTATGNADGGIMKFTPDGNWQWTRLCGAPSAMCGVDNQIVADSSGNTYFRGFPERGDDRRHPCLWGRHPDCQLDSSGIGLWSDLLEVVVRIEGPGYVSG